MLPVCVGAAPPLPSLLNVQARVSLQRNNKQGQQRQVFDTHSFTHCAGPPRGALRRSTGEGLRKQLLQLRHRVLGRRHRVPLHGRMHEYLVVVAAWGGFVTEEVDFLAGNVLELQNLVQMLQKHTGGGMCVRMLQKHSEGGTWGAHAEGSSSCPSPRGTRRS